MKAYYTIDTATAVQAAENLWGDELRMANEQYEKEMQDRYDFSKLESAYRMAPFYKRLFMKRPMWEPTPQSFYISVFGGNDALMKNLKAALPLIETVSLDITNGLERQVAEECKRIVEKEAQ